MPGDLGHQYGNLRGVGGPDFRFQRVQRQAVAALLHQLSRGNGGRVEPSVAIGPGDHRAQLVMAVRARLVKQRRQRGPGLCNPGAGRHRPGFECRNVLVQAIRILLVVERHGASGGQVGDCRGGVVVRRQPGRCRCRCHGDFLLEVGKILAHRVDARQPAFPDAFQRRVDVCQHGQRAFGGCHVGALGQADFQETGAPVGRPRIEFGLRRSGLFALPDQSGGGGIALLDPFVALNPTFGRSVHRVGGDQRQRRKRRRRVEGRACNACDGETGAQVGRCRLRGLLRRRQRLLRVGQRVLRVQNPVAHGTPGLELWQRQSGQPEGGGGLRPVGVQRGLLDGVGGAARGVFRRLLLQAFAGVQPRLQFAHLAGLFMALVGDVVGDANFGFEPDGQIIDWLATGTDGVPDGVALSAHLRQLRCADRMVGIAVLRDSQVLRRQVGSEIDLPVRQRLAVTRRLGLPFQALADVGG